MFRKEEAAVTDWSPETVQMCAARQAEILEEGARMVCPGGRLVYSTCTFAPEENEQTVENFLRRHPEFTLEAVEAPWFSAGEPGCFRLWPHKLLGEGHFAAVLRRTDGIEDEPAPESGSKLPKQWHDFAAQLQLQLPEGKPVLFGQNLFWAPEELPRLQGLRVLRPGLELGELKKDRFEPAHGLALWLQEAALQVTLEGTGSEIDAYLHGQTIPTSCKGWCLVKADRYSIGWGKGDGKILKNHYPKGLRR